MPKENRKIILNKKIATTATEVLKILWEEGIFKKSVKIVDVVRELSRRGYNFPHTNIDKALQRAPYLTKRGKRGGYEYVQKYPYSAMVKTSKSSNSKKDK